MQDIIDIIDRSNAAYVVFELTGRTGSGKSETAKQICEMFERKGKKTHYFEGTLFNDPGKLGCTINQTVVRAGGNELTRTSDENECADLIVIDEIYMNLSERREAYRHLGKIARQNNCVVLVLRQTDEVSLKFKPVQGV